MVTSAAGILDCHFLNDEKQRSITTKERRLCLNDRLHSCALSSELSCSVAALQNGCQRYPVCIFSTEARWTVLFDVSLGLGVRDVVVRSAPHRSFPTSHRRHAPFGPLFRQCLHLRTRTGQAKPVLSSMQNQWRPHGMAWHGGCFADFRPVRPPGYSKANLMVLRCSRVLQGAAKR